jgi:hypothetical protein
MAKKFGSAAAFKTSLEARLRKRAEETNVPLQTLQLKFVMERLLARLFRDPKSPWLLKGGYAMDLRFRPQARTTKDVDLTVLITFGEGVEANAIRESLQDAADVDLEDFLTFRIGEPKTELTNAPGGGARYSCEAVLLGKTYQKFHLDVGCGDAVVGKPEKLTGEDFLDFAGLEPATVLAIPKPQQFAEKIHAYSFPWTGRLNTRTKDLVDLVTLIERDALDPEETRAALRATFATRNTHPLPRELSPPPDSWASDFPGMATEAGLSTTDCHAAFVILRDFWTTNGLGKER